MRSIGALARRWWLPSLVSLTVLVLGVVAFGVSGAGHHSEADTLELVASTQSTTAAVGTTSTTSTTSTTTSTTTTAAPQTTVAPVAAAVTTTKAAPKTVAAPTTAPAPVTTAAPAPPPTPPPANGGLVRMVGDSVMLGAKTTLEKIPGWTVVVDAAVSRQFASSDSFLQTAVAANPARLVIALGTNGLMTDAQFDHVMEIVKGVPKVLIVNVQLPDDRYPNEGATNDVLARGAARWGSRLLDWNGATNGHPEYFGADGTHLTPAGSLLYAVLMTQAL